MKNKSEPSSEKMLISKAAKAGVTCTPTSVIVKRVSEPKPVTENIFQRGKQARAVTDVIFAPIKAVSEEGTGVDLITEDGDDSRKENEFGDDFFDELFSNLEQLNDNLEMLAPHAGNNCISMSLTLPHTLKRKPPSTPSADKPAPSEDKPGAFLLNPGYNLMWANYENPQKKHYSEGPEAGPGPDTPPHWNCNNDGVIKITLGDNLDEPPEQEILACFPSELTKFFFN